MEAVEHSPISAWGRGPLEEDAPDKPKGMQTKLSERGLDANWEAMSERTKGQYLGDGAHAMLL
jgi:hypothetical protein